MSNRPAAFYDDLAVIPDHDFEHALRRQLDADLRGMRSQPFVSPIEHDVVVEVPMMSPDSVPNVRDERHRSLRSIVAVAAAITACITVGVVVDRLVLHDDSDPPALTVPVPTLTPTTIATTTLPPATTTERLSTTTLPSPTTTEPLFTADEVAGIKVLLWNEDYEIPGFSHVEGMPVRLDGSVAEHLPACQAFVATVFESDERPATTEWRLFENTEINALTLQYVVVHPTIAQATAMLDAMQEPAFLEECVPAYLETLPTQCCDDVTSWFPIYSGDELTPPAIDAGADDVWVRRYNTTWTDDDGVVHGPEQFAFAAIRVGRIVTTIEVMLEDAEGREVATIADFERIVQRMAARAAGAQAVS